ncbi:hypothetical protein Tco_1483870 [Tanacetum coccineum]
MRDYWISISSAGDFLGTTLSYNAIRDPILRLYHRLITCSIAGRSQALEKVTVTNLFYLRGMDVGSVNVPYLLARYLRLFAAGRKSGALISRGQFVARLAKYFGLLTEERLRGLTVIAPELRIIPITAPESGPSTTLKMTVPSTTEEKICKKNDVKARSLLLMASYIILNKHTMKVEESLHVTFNESPPPFKTSQLVDDDLVEEEAIEVSGKKPLGNNIEDETLEIEKIVYIKEYKNYPLDNVIGNLNKKTLRSLAQEKASQSEEIVRSLIRDWLLESVVSIDGNEEGEGIYRPTGTTLSMGKVYGITYQSQHAHQSSTPLSITYPSNEYQQSIHHNVYSPSSSIPQLEYAPSVNQQSEFSQPDSGLIVPVFQKGDDPIDAINHMMSFLTAVVTSRYPTTNNQLRNSSNPRQQATINDGRVTVQPVQGRQISYATGEGHMSKQCTKPRRKRDDSWFKDKVLLVQAQASGQILHDEELTFLADPGILKDQATQTVIVIPPNWVAAEYEYPGALHYRSIAQDMRTTSKRVV